MGRDRAAYAWLACSLLACGCGSSGDSVGARGDAQDASIADGASDAGGDDARPDADDEAARPDAALDVAAGEGGSDAGEALLVERGVAGKILLRGTIVTPDVAIVGEVLVDGDAITCVDVSCAGAPGASEASVVETRGVIAPGLVDTHNHVLFDAFDESDWSPTQSYANHDQWPNDARYGAMVDAKQWLNGEGTSTVDLGCQLDKYGELKGLVAGTTSMVGSANPANRSCYASLVRTIDQSPNGLGVDKIQAATIFPTKSAADGVCANFASGKTTAYVIHVGEGVDAHALAEWADLSSITTTAGCLLAPETTIVHGTALGTAELATMAAKGMSLSWSPRSNVFLYGAGSDLTKTTDVAAARAAGVNVALSPDWSIGGSPNLLEELRFARAVDAARWGSSLDARELVRMVTANAAKALALDGVLGSIAVGKKADLAVFRGDVGAPWEAIVAARPSDVRLVLVGGVPLYGDASLAGLAQTTPACEALDACGVSKFVCVASPLGTSANLLGETLAEIRQKLEQGLADYDARADAHTWNFSPIAPMVSCR